MKKQVSAILVAFLMTACVGAAMLGIGGVAFFNKNGEAPADSSKVSAVSASNMPQDVAQLQNLVAQYQTREQQYQQREQQYQQQLADANTQLAAAQNQLQQVQRLLAALQARGLITIENGQIFINH